MAAACWAAGLSLVFVVGAAAVGGQYPMLGGQYPVSVQEPEVLEAALEAAKAFNLESNDSYYSTVSSVVAATKQVVAGIMYRLKIELKTSSCRKSNVPVSSFQNCTVLTNSPSAKKRICDFKVWNRPWLGPMNVKIGACTVVPQ